MPPPGRRPDRPRSTAGNRPPRRKTGPSRRPTDPTRATVAALLEAVRERGAYANLTLPGLLRSAGLTGRDAALATELGYGTLRWQGTLDAVLATCVDRPLAELDVRLLDVLRLGAYQVLHTRIPAYAAVGSAVDLAASRVGEGPARLANAVLRKVGRRDLDGWVDELGTELDPDQRLGLATAHPAWMVAGIRAAIGAGGSKGELAEALAADNARPVVHLVAREMERDELVDEVGGEPGPWSPYAVRLPGGGTPRDWASVRDGRAGVQDEGSQLVALALTRVPVEGPERHWLDLCAGPGGKAALLAAVAPPEVRILAADRSEHRAALVEQATSRAAVDVACVDGLRPAWVARSFDRVLVDAPCTGLGALRRRADARWRRTGADLDDLVELQRGLLDSGLDAVKPGGVLAYVTCSPHPAETVQIVAAITDRADLEVLDAREFLPGVPQLGDGPYVQLWAHRHGTDAMFLALFRRVG